MANGESDIFANLPALIPLPLDNEEECPLSSEGNSADGYSNQVNSDYHDINIGVQNFRSYLHQRYFNNNDAGSGFQPYSKVMKQPFDSVQLNTSVSFQRSNEMCQFGDSNQFNGYSQHNVSPFPNSLIGYNDMQQSSGGNSIYTPCNPIQLSPYYNKPYFASNLCSHKGNYSGPVENYQKLYPSLSQNPQNHFSLSSAKETHIDSHKTKNHTVEKLFSKIPSTLNSRATTSQNHQLRDDGKLKSPFRTGDLTDIINLEKMYVKATSGVPKLNENSIDKVERLTELYSVFVEQMSNFFKTIPYFKKMASTDGPKLLHLAVAISSHLAAAHLLNKKDYTWPRIDIPNLHSTTPVLSATALRQAVSTDHFLLLMKFYTENSRLYQDSRVTLLMEVLALFYDEPDLIDPVLVKKARIYYLGLLSRYLNATFGLHKGAKMLNELRSSLKKARQLTGIHEYIQLGANDLEVSCEQSSLTDNFQKLTNFISDIKDGKQSTDNNGPYDDILNVAPSISFPAPNTDAQEDTIDQVTDLLRHLAACDDPNVLDIGRQYLPPALLNNFLKIVK